MRGCRRDQDRSSPGDPREPAPPTPEPGLLAPGSEVIRFCCFKLPFGGTVTAAVGEPRTFPVAL